MGDDAMEIWKREIAAADAAVPAGAPAPPVSQPPPGFGPARRRFALAGAEKAILALVVPMLIGAAYTALLLLTLELGDMNTALVALPVFLGGFAAAVAKRGPAEIVGWALACWLTAVAVFAIVAPVLIVLDFLDCWASWLSDC